MNNEKNYCFPNDTEQCPAACMSACALVSSLNSNKHFFKLYRLDIKCMQTSPTNQFFHF